MLRAVAFPNRSFLMLRWPTLLPLFAATALTPLMLQADTAPTEPKPPRLAVVISIDQFRGDYLERFGPYFGEGGFKRLAAGGMNFTNCHYPYAMTKTAPGHATILSGVLPSVHGIIGNDWPDMKTGKKLIAVQDFSTQLVGMPEGTPENELAVGRSPHFFLGDTVGDELKVKYGLAAKVVSVSNKDRAAILLGGVHPDIVLWDQDGRYVSSTYYMKSLPAWVESFNAQGLVKALAGTTWDRLLPAEVYDKVQGPDDEKAEGKIQGMGRTFPKTIPAIGADGSTKALYDAYDFVPATQEHLATIAKMAVDAVGLGQDDVPDLLCVGFSQIDAIGHATGPDSHEMMDSVLRLDRVLADFLRDLDAKVGPKNYVVVLTADHGVTSLPELVKAKDPSSPAARIDGKSIELAVKIALNEKLGPPPGKGDWALKYASSFYLDPAKLAEKGIAPADVEKLIKEAVLTVPGVAEAYTRADIENAPAGNDSYVSLARNSYYAERSPDVSYLLRPNCLEAPGQSSNHGTPYEYDTHVPQLYYGPGIQPGTSADKVWVTNIAPTLSAMLQISSPKGAQERNLLPALAESH